MQSKAASTLSPLKQCGFILLNNLLNSVNLMKFAPATQFQFYIFIIWFWLIIGNKRLWPFLYLAEKFICRFGLIISTKEHLVLFFPFVQYVDDFFILVF